MVLLSILPLLSTLSAASTDEDYKSLSFNCDEKVTLAKQMSNEMIAQVESLSIAGTIWDNDLQVIDKCHRLSWLDLTNAIVRDTINFSGFSDSFWDERPDGSTITAIGAGSFVHAPIETLYLPKKLNYLDLRALSLFAWNKDCGRPAYDEGICNYNNEPHFEKTILVYVTGIFPNLHNPLSINGYYGCPLEFKLSGDNEELVEIDGSILSKDRDVLFKAGNLFKDSADNCFFDVKRVLPHAFTYSLWPHERQMITFSERLENLYNFAFSETAIPYINPDENAKIIGGIRFLRWEPVQMGQAYDSTYPNDQNPIPCDVVVVPMKTRYIASDIRWWTYVMDEYEYGVRQGVLTPDSKEEFYSHQDKYGPRMEAFIEEFTHVPFRITGEGYTSSYDDTKTTYMLANISMKKKLSFYFTNPESGKIDTLAVSPFSIGEVYNYRFKVEGTDGREWDVWTDSETHTSSYNDTIFLTIKLYTKERPIIGETCAISFQLIGEKFFGTSDDISTVCSFEEMPFYGGIKKTVESPSNNKLFDLQGRPADGTQKSIYIRNGKKVLVR